ncbi:hypothetical protein PSACC_01644 [Paramicrosporidium saccamoebae]|uniref:C3H1-type domain-containing protein n=1 Tax=Paramicrosporidium saccamoebae TaxID=1246581 RepID=A0A2H9TLJ8_9FUNG|nr:hypothetical protein PSACC_01644 [Paramicrosporidium saccamoebae]
MRHSVFEIKSRKDIACYWEANGGCLKPNCPFKHAATTEGASARSLAPQSRERKTEQVKNTAVHQPVTSRQPNSAERTTHSISPNRSPQPTKRTEEAKSMDFEVKTFEEIMREKRRKLDQEIPVGQVSNVQTKLEPVINSARASALPLNVASKPTTTTPPAEPLATVIPEPAAVTTDKPLTRSTATATLVTPTTAATVPTTAPATATTTVPTDDDDLDRHLAELDELINS